MTRDLGTANGATVSGATLVAAARQFLGTPFVHQGRLPHVGLDCIGLLQATAQSCGIQHQDFAGYGRRPKSDELVRRIADHSALIGKVGITESPDGYGVTVLTSDAAAALAIPGDLMLFWIHAGHRRPQHAGIRTDIGILHTHGILGVSKVVEHGLDPFWIARLDSVWRLRGVAG
jgi:cell wall-associated NlpC family hydrolase